MFFLLAVSNNYPESSSEKIVRIGSKKFTESVILGEIATDLLRASNIKCEHVKQLGGTRILWNALLKGDIDIYPEYTGTIIHELFSGEVLNSFELLKFKLSEKGISATNPIGFNNTYAIGVTQKTARKYNLHKISDLRNYPNLKIAFTNEFMDRKDGWLGLQQTYNLPQSNVNGVDHDLAYKGLASGSVDVIDLYSTDAEIEYYNIYILKDDLHYFPEYKAVYLYRKSLENTKPFAIEILKKLENTIDAKEMRKLNAKVKINKETESKVASDFVRKTFNIKIQSIEKTFWNRLTKTTKDHLILVLISLTAAILLSIPLGIFAFKFAKFGKIVLGITGIIQTIPSLALLVFMIPFFGIGAEPAIVALFLYSLLPIVRNTYLGFQNIPLTIRESGEVLGLSQFQILTKIELPLASRSIISGIKTSSVINVGTATLGALIGAGGYGQPILTGIRLDNISLILEGAVPAAVLALLVQLLFDLSEKIFVPKGLRLSTQN